MSRELRSPLNAILGMTELLRDTPLSPDQRDYVGRLERAAQHLRGLVDDVLDHSAADAVGSATAEDLNGLGAVRVLVVEDIEDNREVVRLFLKDTPCRVDVAQNGAIATEKMRADTYDLVLMDLQMPVMDGCQATASIRQWEVAHGRPQTPIVALSASAFQDDIDKALAAGCNTHVAKPVTRSTLLAIVQKYASPHSDRMDDRTGEPPMTNDLSVPRPPTDPAPPGEIPIVRVDACLEPLMPRFLTNRQADVAVLEQALVARDFETLRQVSHAMKGAGGSFGFDRITELASVIEQAAKAADASTIAHDLPLMRRYLEHVQVVFER